MHRIKSILIAISPKASNDTIIPYLDSLIKKEDDEVLYAIAEEIGKVWPCFYDKNALVILLEHLCSVDETVVRDQGAKSLIEISKSMSENEIQSIVTPSVIKLAQSDWFTGRVSACSLILALYAQAGIHKEKMRK